MLSTRYIRQSRRIPRACLAAATVAAIVSTVGPIATPANAKTPTLAFGPKESPLGRAYANWLGAWAKWAFSGPAETSPILSLQNCDQWQQPEPTTTWFLSANGPGTADVTCSVPANLPIALTAGGIYDWQAPGDEAKLTANMKLFPKVVRKPTLSVDGVKVDATKYAVTSPVLSMNLVAPEFGPAAGPDKPAVILQARSWMLVLKGLKPGIHKVVISDEGSLDENGQPLIVNGKQKWIFSSVNYTLNVGSGPAQTTVPPTTVPRTTVPPTTVPPTTAPTTTLAAAPAAKVLFEDDFNDPKSGWLDDNGGGWTMGYTNGKYRITAEPGNGGQVGPDHAGQPSMRNSRTEIDFELIAGDGAAVVHCYDAIPRGSATARSATVVGEPEHLYIAVSPKGGIRGYTSVGGKRTSIPGGDMPSLTAAFRKENRLAVECSGESGKPGRVKVWLNTVQIFDADVPVMPSGDGLSLAMEAFRGLPAKGEVIFDNLVVTAM